MRPVFQSRRKISEGGDCLNACIASLLELDLRDVPDFAIYEDNAVWWKAAQDFCFLHGYQLWRIEIAKQVAWYNMPAEPLLIVIGPHKTGAPHACIGYAKSQEGQEVEFMVIHDPLGGEGVESVDAVMFLVPVNPATQSRLLVDMQLIQNILDANTSQSRKIIDARSVAASWKREPAPAPEAEKKPREIVWHDPEAGTTDKAIAENREEQAREQEQYGSGEHDVVLDAIREHIEGD